MTTRSDQPQLVTIFGGSGFVGRYLVQSLARRGYRVRVACRRPDLAYYLQPLGNVGQVQAVQANVRHRWSVERAVEGADFVVNLVGILFEGGPQRFDAVQEFGARAIAEAARSAGVPMVHMSALGARPDSDSRYQQTKGRAENAVLEIVPDAIVVKPSVIFGPEDQFFNRFANLARVSPVLPLIGGGQTRFQPVYVGDVVEAICRGVEGTLIPGQRYELGGPQVMSFRQCMELMLEVTNRKRWLMPLPWWMARLQASFLGLLPNPVLTLDQIRILKHDNVVSQAAMDEGRTLLGMGIESSPAAPLIPTYMEHFRAAGQFEDVQSA